MSHFSDTTSSDSSQRRVAYFYDPDVGSYYYGEGHPMKPQRIKMAHQLIVGYDMYRQMDVYRPHKASEVEMSMFHARDYVSFLRTVTPDNIKDYPVHGKKFNVGEHTDCPVFEGLYELNESVAGATIDAAITLNEGLADIAINWSGGLHHAKRSEASGFCYVNDIVLGILELLKYHPRVLYIDIDVHHGDGVEEAFYLTPRVMTVSFHKFGDFFPGTGDITDIGENEGQFYSLNVPLDEGLNDEQFIDLFKVVISKTVETYRPGAIVLQCGADSLTRDRLGRFNLTLKGHAECVKICRGFGLPLMLLGGGGYTIRNVARCWAYETSVALNQPISGEIPANDFWLYYAPDFQLHLEPRKDLTNLNSEETLGKIKQQCLSNLEALEAAPGVDFAYVPQDLLRTIKLMAESSEKREMDSATGPRKTRKRLHAGELNEEK
jgi:histone deacetylase 1/2